MIDTDPTTPAHTSGCGNVTIVDGGGQAPTVRLTVEAVRLPVRDLAELITNTARDAADAARAAQSAADGRPLVRPPTRSPISRTCATVFTRTD